jgi:Trypsin-like peptidase domain/SIR2-like domain
MPIEDAVVLLTSTEPDKNKNFGSAFIIARDDSYSYLLTCAHVVEQINGTEIPAAENKLKILGSKQSVEIVEQGSSKEIDIALLKIADLFDKPLFDKFMLGQKQSDIQVTGYSLFDSKDGRRTWRTLKGKLSNRVKITSNNQEYPFLDVLIQDDDFCKLECGYSGSPLYNSAGQVLGVVSHKRTGEMGHAFCISNLKTLYPEIETILPNFKQLTATFRKTPSLSDIRTRMMSRQKDFFKIRFKLRDLFNQMEKEGIDNDAELILEMCEAFLNDEINAADFMEGCFPPETSKSLDNQQLNYELFARRLREGEICLCLGTELPKLFDSTLKSEQELIQQIALLTRFEGANSRPLAEICEYAELHTACTRHSLVSELKKVMIPPLHYQPQNELYDLLLTLTNPFLVIATGFDTLLEQRLSNGKQPFVSIVTNMIAESENQRYLLKSFNAKQGDKSIPSSCSDDELSALQLMEQGYSIIFYPRGYLEVQETLLLSERDYFFKTNDLFFNVNDLLKKRYPAYLRNKLKTKGLWFLGYQPDSWETRLLAKVLQYQRDNKDRDFPVVIQPNVDSFAQLFWQEMQCKHYDLTVNEFVAKLGEAL